MRFRTFVSEFGGEGRVKSKLVECGVSAMGELVAAVFRTRILSAMELEDAML